MQAFASALTNWFTSYPKVSLRQLSEAAELTATDLGRIRSDDKDITFKALCKLLPAIEKLSDRTEARTLLVAYLNDETPPDFSADVRVYAVDQLTGTVEKDAIAIARDRWEAKARSNPTFAAMWMTLDGYMHEADSDAVDANVARFTKQANDDLALVAEDTPDVATTPIGSTHPVQKAVDDINAQFSQLREGDVNKKNASEA